MPNPFRDPVGWFRALDPPQKLLVGAGVPIAAGAALVGNLRSRQPSPEDPGSTPIGPVLSSTPTLAPGFGDVTDLHNAIAADFGAVTERVERIEDTLAAPPAPSDPDTPTRQEVQEATEALQRDVQRVEQSVREEVQTVREELVTRTTPKPEPAPAPKPAPKPPPAPKPAPKPDAFAAGIDTSTGIGACTLSLRTQIASILTARGWARFITLGNLDALINTFYGRQGGRNCLLNSAERGMLVNHFRVYQNLGWPRALADDINRYLQGLGLPHRFQMR